MIEFDARPKPTGKIEDKESGLPHMWHLLTNAAFLTALETGQEKG